jgi:plasmid stabilization system protein ParE
MASRRVHVVWSERARDALDEAVAYVAENAADIARRILQTVLDAAASLDILSSRGRIVSELNDIAFRELLVDPFRLTSTLWHLALDLSGDTIRGHDCRPSTPGARLSYLAT